MRRRPLAAAAFALAAAACRSFSDSSESISESVNNSLESVSHSLEGSSDSSSPDGTAAAAQGFRRDVGVFTVAWLQRDEPGREPGDLARGISRIAAEYGLTEWETLPATRSAVRDAARDEQVDDAGRALLREELERVDGDLAREVREVIGAP